MNNVDHSNPREKILNLKISLKHRSWILFKFGEPGGQCIMCRYIKYIKTESGEKCLLARKFIFSGTTRPTEIITCQSDQTNQQFVLTNYFDFPEIISVSIVLKQWSHRSMTSAIYIKYYISNN